MFAQPNGKYMICKKIEVEQEQTTKSGLILANVPNMNLPKAEVLAVGDGYMGPDGKWHELKFKAGDIIMYGFNNDVPFEHEDKQYVVVHADTVIATFNE